MDRFDEYAASERFFGGYNSKEEENMQEIMKEIEKGYKSSRYGEEYMESILDGFKKCIETDDSVLLPAGENC